MKHFTLLLFLCLMASCGSGKQEDNIVSVTIEPQRYFAERIAGDKYTINCVVPTGQNPETYDPTPQQMVQIGRSTAYLQIGPIGFEQAWIETIRQHNPNIRFFDLSEGIALIGEADESGESHDAHHHEEGEHLREGEEQHHHHHGGIDPHIWSSVDGARSIAFNTLNAFVTLDKENAAYYWENYNKLLEEIDKTEKTISELLKPVLSRAFIIYHPALTYFAEEFNLTQLSIEMDGKEPSPAQLKELVDLAHDYNVRVVFVQQEFNRDNAALIARETGCRLVTINPLDYDWNKEMIHIAQSLADE